MGDLNEIKFIIKSLLVSCPVQMTVSKLIHDFNLNEGYPLPYKKFGFNNAETFLRSLTDTIQVIGSGTIAVVELIKCEKSDHIFGLVQSQKNTSKQKKRRPNVANRVARSTSHNYHQNNFKGGPQYNTMTLDYSKPNNYVQMMPVQLPYFMVQQNHQAYANHMAQQNHQAYTNHIVNMRNQQMINAYNNFRNSPNPVQLFHNTNNQQRYHQRSSGKNSQNVYNNANKKPADVGPSSMQKSSEKPSSVKIDEKKVSFGKVISEEANKISKKCDEVQSNKEIEASRDVLPGCSKNVTSLVEEEKSRDVLPGRSNEAPILVENDDLNVSESVKESNQIQVESDESQQKVPPSTQLKKLLESRAVPQNGDPLKTVKKSEVKQTKEKKEFFSVSDDDINLDDLKEAIPRFAANELVFSLDFPYNAIKPGQKIPKYEIPENLKEDALIRLFVTEVHNPFKFWFHINYEGDNDIDLLMNKMEHFYEKIGANEFCMPIPCMKPGQVCAASYEGLWHRADIIKITDSEHVKCYFLDYGTVYDVDLKSIKYLHTSFGSLPAQAMRGSLSCIKPVGPSWTLQANFDFLSLSSNVMLFGKIKEINREDRILYLVLCNNTGGKTININKELESLGHARFNADWSPEKIQKVGARIHHPREDHPTFDMLEQGFYPSLPDLVKLRIKGIHFERIFDLKYYHPANVIRKKSKKKLVKNLPFFLLQSNPFSADILSEYKRSFTLF